MKIPNNLKIGDCIGICAPSAGIEKPEKQLKLDYAIKQLKEMGFNVVETESVRKDVQGRSASKEIRAKEFLDLYLNPDVHAIIFAAGGDFLVEMLECINFDDLKNVPTKWMAGYSDITGISFLMTTILEVPTLYTQTIKDFAMKPLHKSLEDAIKIMMGEYPIQESYEKCEKKVNMLDLLNEINPSEENTNEEAEEVVDPTEEYKLEEDVIWKNLYNEDVIEIKGRAIGGCLDLVKNLIGTKFDKVKEYIDKYKEEGIVWFFDVFESSTPEIVRTLLQFKNAGYFKYCKGILVGRCLFLREDYELDIAESLKQGLDGLNIPVIYDMDIGHVSPQMPIINGGKIEVKSENGKGTLRSYLD